MSEYYDIESELEYSFITDSLNFASVTTKSGKKYYVEGYISTDDIDIDNDLITKDGLKSMVDQLNSGNIKLDYEHEAFRDDKSILPVGKILKAELRNNKVWVKCELNKASPKFKDLWNSIKKGFVDAFSVAFKPLRAIKRIIKGKTVTLIHDLKMLNVAFTGVPVNQNAKITNVITKALNDSEVLRLNSEELKQKEEKLKSLEAELKSKQDEMTAKEEKLKSLEAELKKKSEEIDSIKTKSKDDVEVIQKALKEHTELVESMNKKIKGLEAELKDVKEAPMLKGFFEAPPAPGKSGKTSISMLSMI